MASSPALQRGPPTRRCSARAARSVQTCLSLMPPAPPPARRRQETGPRGPEQEGADDLRPAFISLLRGVGPSAEQQLTR